MTKASRDTQTRRRERKGRRKRERGKRGAEDKCSQQGLGGGRGTKLSTGSNEPQKCFDRCGHLVPCQSGWLLRPLRSRKGMSQLGIPKKRQKSEFSRPRPPTLAASCSGPGRRDKINPRSTGPREALCGLIPGWHEARHTYDWVY